MRPNEQPRVGGGTKLLYLDIMREGRFVCTVKMPYCPLFTVNVSEITDYIFKQRPSLKGKDFNVEFSTGKPIFAKR